MTRPEIEAPWVGADVRSPWLRMWAGLRRLARGAEADPVWARPALLALLIATLVLYLWSLTVSGWANTYYSAAVQAGTESWKALFFGSFDSSNYITVDKTPAALWVMALSARIFGLSEWSVLVPQALEGVATVAVLYAAVRRRGGPAAGLIAGAVVALTPVAALMFRYNNPDALLTLVLVGSAYATLRGVEDGRTRWLVLAGTLVGFGYLTKMLQAFIVLPVFALVYLVAGPPRLLKRLWQLAAAGLAVLVSAGWWVAIVELTPAPARPYIGGSTTNSILQLTFGYNGLGRITGNEVGAVGRGGAVPPGGFGGGTGFTRLFANEIGGQISWLIPAALVALVVGLWIGRRAARTDMLRAELAVWGGWLLLTGGILSFAGGIIHAYYTVVLAPAIGALLGIAAPLLWLRRDDILWRSVTGIMTAGTAVWSFVLLQRTPDWHPWLRWVVVSAGLAAAIGYVAAGGGLGRRGWQRVLLFGAVGVLALAGLVGGPAAYTLSTVSQAHAGGIPSAGPPGAGGGPGGFRGPGAGPGGMRPPLPGGGADGRGGGARPVLPGGGVGGQNGGTRPALPGDGGAGAPIPGGAGQGFIPGVPGGFRPPGGPGPGGFGQPVEVGEELVALLQDAADSHRWAAAMTAASTAAPYQLASGAPIMAVGGFNGTDQSMSLGDFKDLVASGDVGYYIVGGGFAGSPNMGLAGEIAAWVQQTFRQVTVGGATVYDLSAPVSGAAG